MKSKNEYFTKKNAYFEYGDLEKDLHKAVNKFVFDDIFFYLRPFVDLNDNKILIFYGDQPICEFSLTKQFFDAFDHIEGTAEEINFLKKFHKRLGDTISRMEKEK